MCGIALCLCGEHECVQDLQEEVWRSIKPRGPNQFGTYAIEEKGEGDEDSCEVLGVMGGAVLHIQGDELAVQPMHDDTGGCLLWNGEVFGGIDKSMSGSNEDNGVVMSDTCAVSKLLSQALGNVSEHTTCAELATIASECLSVIEGPFAFIYYNSATKSVVFGRDPFGRRSLVGLRAGDTENGAATGRYAVIASTATLSCYGKSLKWDELTVQGVYAQKLVPQFASLPREESDCVQMPWPSTRLKLGVQLKTSSHQFGVEESISQKFLNVVMSCLRNRMDVVHDLNSSDSTVSSECPIGVLFSGGIDSVFLTALLHECLPLEYSIDLVNVSFDGPDEGERVPAPDRLAAIVAHAELQTLFPKRVWRLVHVDVAPQEREVYESRVISLIQPQSTHMDLNIGSAFWFASRGAGYTCQYTDDDIVACLEAAQDDGRPLLRKGGEGYAKGRGEKPQLSEKHNCSDGTEGTIITDTQDYTCNNVEGSKTNKSNENNSNKNLDRIPCNENGCSQISKPGCLYNLCKRCCVKKFKLENTSSHKEDIYQQKDNSNCNQCPVHRKTKKECKRDPPHVLKSPHAKSLVSDKERLAAAKFPYQTECKILIVGIGADEQLAGYSRHRTVYKRGGVRALTEELNMDTSRIYNRNLGRDDRCISDHGREAWFPFLDEKVVRFLQETPLDMICNLDEPQGEGDKKILRDAAQILGLQSCTSLVKRAIQFGTRVAKHTNVKYHGSNRNGKGTTLIK